MGVTLLTSIDLLPSSHKTSTVPFIEALRFLFFITEMLIQMFYS